MGIQGLIPFLKKASRPTHIRNWKGCTVAVDVFCWLHRGAYSCALKLAKGEQTDGYIHYCIKMVNMLLAAGVTPILVFDGQNLPSKAVTEHKRHENRVKYKQMGKLHLIEGRVNEATDCFQRSVEVTSQMARDLIKACRKLGVDCIVAPYEADAQLAYLNRAGIADIVITEDSDLVLFGCNRVMFKLDAFGNGVMFERSLLHSCLGTNSENFTFDKFRYMCILSGCDYLPSLPGIGLVKACKFFTKTIDPNLKSILPKVPGYLNMPQLSVTKDYIDKFIQANNTFLYQLVFDPINRALVPLNPYPPDLDPSTLDYAGPNISGDTAYNIALGNIDVGTLKMMDNYDPDNAKIVACKTFSWNSKQNHRAKSIWSKDYILSKSVITLKDKPQPQRLSTERLEAIVPTPKKLINKPGNTKRFFSEINCGSDLPNDEDLISIYKQEDCSPKRLKGPEDKVPLCSTENMTTKHTPNANVDCHKIFPLVVHSRFFSPKPKILQNASKTIDQQPSFLSTADQAKNMDLKEILLSPRKDAGDNALVTMNEDMFESPKVRNKKCEQLRTSGDSSTTARSILSGRLSFDSAIATRSSPKPPEKQRSPTLTKGDVHFSSQRQHSQPSGLYKLRQNLQMFKADSQHTKMPFKPVLKSPSITESLLKQKVESQVPERSPELDDDYTSSGTSRFQSSPLLGHILRTPLHTRSRGPGLSKKTLTHRNSKLDSVGQQTLRESLAKFNFVRKEFSSCVITQINNTSSEFV